jgi:hypothetical protein
MPSDIRDEGPIEDPESRLERAFIEEFLRLRGHDVHSVAMLPDAECRRLLGEASTYAALRLAEVNARSHYVHDIHDR